MEKPLGLLRYAGLSAPHGASCAVRVKAVGAASLSPHLFLSKTAPELLPGGDPSPNLLEDVCSKALLLQE